MATHPAAELIWQGRLHLGDEPGIYGDANYAGICAELPFTVRRIVPADVQDKPFKIILETEDVTTYAGYPGHAIDVMIYEPDPTNPNHWIESSLLPTQRLASGDNNRKELTLSSGTRPGPLWISLRLRVDTTVSPGLYDDFVWIKLSLLSEDFTYYASFGFDNPL